MSKILQFWPKNRQFLMKSILVKKYQNVPLRRRHVQKIKALKSEKDPNRSVFLRPAYEKLTDIPSMIS